MGAAGAAALPLPATWAATRPLIDSREVAPGVFFVTGAGANVIALRVTDTFGQTATVNANVTVYRAMPTAVIVQSPRPTPITRPAPACATPAECLRR